MQKSALEGLRVLELGSLIAGPFAGRIFADFGAEVIKVENEKDGDPLRVWREVEEGTSLWWYVQSRNKKSVEINLKSELGQRFIKEIVKGIDIIIENFRPGKLEEWGIGYEDLKKINPKLIMVRISGFGQDGPKSKYPGFGSIGEAMGGLRYLTGYPDRPPTRVGLSIGDSIAGLYGVIGALMAVYYRDNNSDFEGQCVDVSLYESIFSLTESLVPEYDRKQVIRERSGSTLPGITPSNTYECKDNQYVVIGANGDSIFKRLMLLIGREDIANDERFTTNALRNSHAEYLDGVIAEWTKSKDIDSVVDLLNENGIPAGKIYSVKDIIEDSHYKEREMILDIETPIGPLKMPGIVPKLSISPGKVKWAGPELGANNSEFLKLDKV
ncbi:CaiB/BaiF CoA transferase family protein [Ureibacillus aquaedulcis]|uniref:CoA transferase n=1 Tax=Ureibacillus aquaedulcis TaxID=3058421 RepID=A0ABT8GW46_9BACL|nr:CoA transferase [Ureibacillus sp. BA0131]MDN4495586.1 CoA transferase [Ureibacillus sp. BA0131]